MNEQMTLFDHKVPQPLPARLRPETIDDVVGQQHLLGEGRILRNIIEQDMVSSMIFWGPPGVGKTTLAGVIANQTNAKFINFSAVTSGIKDIRKVMQEAEQNRHFGEKTIVFVDEIHRFNKAQQDAFLPFVEKGSIILIGATTENPSFEVNGALLSRCKVFVMKALEEEDLVKLLRRALETPEGFGDQEIEIDDEVVRMIAAFANGDARVALSTLEMAVLNGEVKTGGEATGDAGNAKATDTAGDKDATGDAGDAKATDAAGDKEATDAAGKGPVIRVTEQTVEQCTSRKSLLYDKNGEEHYNLISALHKSMRNSDPDAAVYWLARMLEAWEDPLYIARRVTRFASEDVGLADPRALEICVAAFQACHLIGMPECSVNLAEAVIYVSLAPKSNAVDMAYINARADAMEQLSEPVPLHIRNGVTDLMRDVGYGKGYQFAHDYEERITDMECMPDSLKGREYYRPTKQGFEERFGQRLEQIKEWKKQKREQSDSDEE